MPFADEIRKLRQQQFMSQTDFANLLGVSFTTVNRWENGKSKPSYKAMKNIDKYCKEHNIVFDFSSEFLDGEQ